MRHINIPIFIPHLGCPNQCIFCNQRYISGRSDFEVESVETQIIQVLSTVSIDDECEIAFFGGSFTGIDRNLMISLLEIAQKYVNLGRVKGIRMSTRPDYISKEIIDILNKYSISCVELGIQTMNDDVLSFLKRGHTVEQTILATKLLNESKIPFVGQMMIGLPSSTVEDEIYCAEQISKLGACGTRIYPTLIFKNTEMEELYHSGDYIPMELDEAVTRSAKVLRVFYEYGIPCIRIGLCDSDNLHSTDSFVAGPNVPNIGEMVKGELIKNLIVERLDKNYNYRDYTLIIECARGQVSQVVGNKRINIIKLKKIFGFRSIKVKENIELSYMSIKLSIKEENS